MAYRGGDLDLRTPRTWSASAPEPAPPAYDRSRGAYAPGPIWVDEVVLACVNHAYDVALAHRSAEVRLEHLLHALTRIDTAAEVLEIRGVRVAALRRESATVIASELPANLPAGETGPRHSEELEHVLRAASLIASRRNAPATVDDVLQLMLDEEPDLPGLGLLARVEPRFSTAGGNGTSYARPPRATYNSYAYAPPRDQSSPAPRPSRSSSRTSRNDSVTSVDSAQNARLDALEQMLRSLSADFGTDRNTLSSLLNDLQRDVSTLRTAPLDIGPIADRIGTIERSITAGFEQFSLAIASIENDIRARGHEKFDLAPLANRLEIIEEAVLSRDTEKLVRELSERLDRLETTLAGERTRAAETAAVLRGEIGQLGQSIETHRTDLANAILPIGDRVAEFRSAIEARQTESFEILSARVASIEQLVASGQTAARDDLAEVSDAIVKLNANQHTLAGNIEQARNDTRESLVSLHEDVRVTSASLTGALDAMNPRFAMLEGETQRIVGAVDGLSGTVENMYRMTIERYYRRNRFWYWLFGTDDWVAASWPSQSSRIAEDLAAVKIGHKR